MNFVIKVDGMQVSVQLEPTIEKRGKTYYAKFENIPQVSGIGSSKAEALKFVWEMLVVMVSENYNDFISVVLSEVRNTNRVVAQRSSNDHKRLLKLASAEL
jgi:hypothetical protein